VFDVSPKKIKMLRNSGCSRSFPNYGARATEFGKLERAVIQVRLSKRRHHYRPLLFPKHSRVVNLSMWRHRGFWTLTLAMLVLATLGKYFANGWHAYTHKGPERGILEAKSQGLYLSRFRIDPPTLKHGDITFEFGEAWVEARYEPSYFLIWYSEEKRMDWDYFCLEPKTDYVQKDFSISLTPEFFPPYKWENYGALNDFSMKGFLWYQMVPKDLKRVRITVTAEWRGGKTVTLGTAELTRE